MTRSPLAPQRTSGRSVVPDRASSWGRRLVCLGVTLTLGCAAETGLEENQDKADSLAAIAQILANVEQGTPRLHLMGDDNSDRWTLGSMLVLDNLESITLRWERLDDFPEGTGFVDVKKRNAEGIFNGRWDHLSAASYNTQTGYVLYEPATSALHFAGFTDRRTDSPFVYRRQVLTASRVSTESSSLFSVQDVYHDERRALPAVHVDTDGMVHMAAVLTTVDGLAWMRCDPATPDDCYDSHEFVASSDYSMYALAASTVGSSPVVAWMQKDGSNNMVLESRYRDATGVWQDLGGIQLPPTTARFSTVPTLQFRQGFGRLIMFVKIPDHIYDVSDGGDMLVYELESGGWSLRTHLTYPYVPNSLGGNSFQLRLSAAGFVVLTSACVEADDRGCKEAGWRLYREDSAEMSEWYGESYGAGVDGVAYSAADWREPPAPVVGTTLPSANGEASYPNLPAGRVRLDGPYTPVPVNMTWTYDSTDNWPRYDASGDARVDCSLGGDNPGRVRISCQAWTPPFNRGPGRELTTTCTRDIGPTPAVVECDSAKGSWRGTVDVDAEGVHFVVSSLAWHAPEGSWLSGSVPTPIRVNLNWVN